MVKKKTVDAWNIKEIGLNLVENRDDEVETIYCKICKEYYLDDENGRSSLDSLAGNVRKTVLNWIGGSKVVKKNNVTDHLKANYHITAMRILRERACLKGDEPSQTEAEKVAVCIGEQMEEESILTHLRQLNQTQKEQLKKKFQLAHFVVIQNLSFNKYHEIAMFEKESHGVGLGNGFLTNKSGREIAIYLSSSLLEDNVTRPLNKKERHYFSLLFDGSSAAKINDEKELYIIKTCDKGTPKYDVLSLEEPEDTNAQGLHESLQNAVSKGKFNFHRKERMVGLGSDFRIKSESNGICC